MENGDNVIKYSNFSFGRLSSALIHLTQLNSNHLSTSLHFSVSLTLPVILFDCNLPTVAKSASAKKFLSAAKVQHHFSPWSISLNGFSESEMNKR